MIETYQEELNQIDEEMKQLKTKKKQLIKQIEQAGFMVEKDTVKENTSVIGLLWNLSYYSSYVGEKGALYDRCSGASQITDEDFETLKTLFKNVEENEEAILEIILPQTNAEDYFLEEL